MSHWGVMEQERVWCLRNEGKYGGGVEEDEVDGEIVHDFPIGVKLAKAKPVYEFVDGWNCDISKCRKKEELPEKALKYIQYIEKQMNCPIQYVSVGAEREAYIKMF